MESLPLNTQLGQWANDTLVWIGFGTLVGLLAKAIMPGRDPGGAVATLAMGIGGTVIGCATLSYYCQQRVTPLSLLGLVVATAGAFVLLAFYRLLAGYWFTEGGRMPRPQFRRTRRVRRVPAVQTSRKSDGRLRQREPRAGWRLQSSDRGSTVGNERPFRPQKRQVVHAVYSCHASSVLA